MGQSQGGERAWCPAGWGVIGRAPGSGWGAGEAGAGVHAGRRAVEGRGSSGWASLVTGWAVGAHPLGRGRRRHAGPQCLWAEDTQSVWLHTPSSSFAFAGISLLGWGLLSRHPGQPGCNFLKARGCLKCFLSWKSKNLIRVCLDKDQITSFCFLEHR